MGVNTKLLLPAEVDIPMIKDCLNRVMGSEIVKNKDGSFYVVSDFVMVDNANKTLDQEVIKTKARLKEIIEKENKLGLRGVDNDLKVLEKAKFFMDAHEEELKKINFNYKSLKWCAKSLTGEYHNLQLSYDDNYCASLSVMTGKIDGHEKKPDMPIGKLLNPTANLTCGYLCNELLEMFGGKIVWFDTKDNDEEGSYKIINRSDARVIYNPKDVMKTRESYYEALLNVPIVTVERVKNFAEKYGYAEKDSRLIDMVVPHQKGREAELMRTDLENNGGFKADNKVTRLKF